MSQEKSSGGLLAGLVLGLPLVLIFMLLIIIAGAQEEHAAQTNCTLNGGTQPAAHVDPSSVPEGPVAGYSGEQLVNAATIMLAARELNLSQHAQQIGVMAAMGESSLRNLGHGDAVRNDTIGLFQIGPEHGTRPQRMDPMWSAKNFFTRLTAIAGWETLEPTIAAHRAQRNADPYHYRKHWNPAGQVIAALGNVQAGPSAVPAANTGGTSTSSSYNLGNVQPQLRAMVEVLGPMFGIETVGGYRESATDPNGHPAGLAADLMVPTTAAGKAQGDALAEYARANAKRLGIDYIIWYQRIWSVGRADEGWRPMEDRGSPTANHLDHVHINVLPDGSVPSSGGSNITQTLAQNCAPALTSSGAWIAPIDAPTTSNYGFRIHPVNGGSSFHDGVDYGASCGSPFKAASGGVVVKAGPDSIYGHQIIIDHGGGITTKYGHMYASGVLVSVGDQVTTGDVIGKVGSDGWSTGCHLHFTVTVDGEHTDPLEFLANPPATNGIGGGLTVVQANVKSNRGDIATVAGIGADFLSFNEVSRLSNKQLRPAGYKLWRASKKVRGDDGTAVLWNQARWSKVNAGRVELVSHGPQKWDYDRGATWATVQNADGGRASIVSVHMMINPAKYGPNKPKRQRLYAAGMRKLQALVSQLSLSGPVFVAGDFNSQYGANDPWGPRRMLGAIGMRSTFDVHGSKETHDAGGRIDYVFFQPAAAASTGQRTLPLNSDHHALIAPFAPAG